MNTNLLQPYNAQGPYAPVTFPQAYTLGVLASILVWTPLLFRSQGLFTLRGCVSEPSKFLLKIVNSRLSFTEKWPHLTELPVSVNNPWDQSSYLLLMRN